jgi:hypothetical protein
MFFIMLNFLVLIIPIFKYKILGLFLNINHFYKLSQLHNYQTRTIPIKI